MSPLYNGKNTLGSSDNSVLRQNAHPKKYLEHRDLANNLISASLSLQQTEQAAHVNPLACIGISPHNSIGFLNYPYMYKIVCMLNMTKYLYSLFHKILVHFLLIIDCTKGFINAWTSSTIKLYCHQLWMIWTCVH